MGDEAPRERYLDALVRDVATESQRAGSRELTSVFLGGGTAAEATYDGPSGRFTITMMADNPMVASMAGILGNAGLIATMGQLERINRENFLRADNELSGLIGGRILIQASGPNADDMIAHLEQIDFGELEDFGQ